MALSGYRSWAVTDAGNVIGLAAVEVRRKADNSLATLFTDVGGGTGVTNPFTAESDGSFEFYTAPDRYDLLVGTGPSQETVPIDIIDARENLTFDLTADFEAWVAGGGLAPDGAIVYAAGIGHVAISGSTANKILLGRL